MRDERFKYDVGLLHCLTAKPLISKACLGAGDVLRACDRAHCRRVLRRCTYGGALVMILRKVREQRSE